MKNLLLSNLGGGEEAGGIAMNKSNGVKGVRGSEQGKVCI